MGECKNRNRFQMNKMKNINLALSGIVSASRRVVEGCKIALFATFLLFCLVSMNQVHAEDRFQAGVQYQYVQPVQTLAGWFDAASSFYGISIGRIQDARWSYRFQVEALEFTEGNKDALQYDDLALNLKLYGAHLGWQYNVLEKSRYVNPFLTWDIGIYRWFAERGEYTISDSQTGSSLYIPSRNQQDWSWGGSAGAGAEIEVIRSLSIIVSVRYRIIIGELWPALSLGLENVSGFQMLDMGVMLGYRF